ncbi:uncharacterized protein [Phaseolus vulgaris]|uniref:uncharacterized protein isoform X2 n=1 Tax=Phaseolus vulgaris TaxID=3885 RepID=UPI0035CB1650
MAKLWCFSGTPLLPSRNQFRRNHGVQRCSNTNMLKSMNTYASMNKESESETPQILKIVVTGVTELLRLFSPSFDQSSFEKQSDQFPISTVDDVLSIIKSDYDNAYFVTGNFTSSIYAENCIFEDPTIKFRGRELYARNLKLLVPFFDQASIILQKIEKSLMEKTTIFVLSKWSLTWRRIMKSFRCQNELVDYVPVRGTRLLSEIYERCNVSVCEPANFEEAKKSLNWIAVMKKLLSMIEKNQT